MGSITQCIHPVSGECLYRVRVGGKMREGFLTPLDAGKCGLDLARDKDERFYQLTQGKSTLEKIRIVFGAEIFQRFFDTQEKEI